MSEDSPPFDKALLNILACPVCEEHPRLALLQERDSSYVLRCKRCEQHFPIVNTIPLLVQEKAVFKQVGK